MQPSNHTGKKYSKKSLTKNRIKEKYTIKESMMMKIKL